MKDKTVNETRLRLAQVMTPNDANILGNVFGGSILAMIDLTASATSQQFAGTTCVTAAFDRVDFHEPIEVGNLVTMEGYIAYAGRTSMEVTIDVYATNLAKGVERHTNTARVTMVAIRDGKPAAVPKLICETREDKINFLLARDRRARRNVHLEDLERSKAQLENSTEDELNRLLLP